MIKSNKRKNIKVDVPIKLSGILGGDVIKIKDLKDLKAESILEFPKLAGDPVTIYLSNSIKFGEGDGIVVNERFGVRITQIYENNVKLKRKIDSDKTNNENLAQPSSELCIEQLIDNYEINNKQSGEKVNNQISLQEEFQRYKRLDNILVEYEILLGWTSVSLSVFKGLKIGDCIQFESDSEKPLYMLINGMPFATGFSGIIKSFRAFKVHKLLSNDEINEYYQKSS